MGKKAVIIGAGVGGAACAAMLAKTGYEVTLLESHSFPGGRCASFEREGFRYDFGVHMFSLGERGPHDEVNRRLGGNLSWITREPGARLRGVFEFEFPRNIKPLTRQVSLARQLGVRPKNYVGAFRLIRSLMSGRRVEENDGINLKDYVSKFTDDQRIHLFINCVSQLFFALSYQEASAGEFIWCFSRMFNEASYGYPKGGSGEIPNSFLKGLERFGGKTVFKEPVTRIIIQGGKVRGVETASGTYTADVVVSNAGVRRSLDLAGRENFPEDYVKRVDGYRYSNAYVTVKYALERPIIPHPIVFYMPDLPPERIFRYIDEKTEPEDPYIFMPVPSNYDPGVAPPGKQLVIAGTPAPPEASPELCDAILNKVHARVCDLFPGFEEALLWQSRATSTDAHNLTGHPEGEAIGLAQYPDQAGEMRPDLATPIEGLWLVGADTRARGIGTEMASASALRLADLLDKASENNLLRQTAAATLPAR